MATIQTDEDAVVRDRRAFLTNAGRFALIVPPAMTVLMSTSLSSSAIAQSGGSVFPRRKGNNGIGNGQDPAPPGNPPINDGPGTAPGNPGNRGGAKNTNAKHKGAP